MSRRRKVNMKTKIPAAERLPREKKMERKKVERSHNKTEREKMVFECVRHTFNPFSSGLQRLRAVGNWTSAEQRWSPPSGPVGGVFLLLFFTL